MGQLWIRKGTDRHFTGWQFSPHEIFWWHYLRAARGEGGGKVEINYVQTATAQGLWFPNKPCALHKRWKQQWSSQSLKKGNTNAQEINTPHYPQFTEDSRYSKVTLISISQTLRTITSTYASVDKYISYKYGSSDAEKVMIVVEIYAFVSRSMTE